MFPTWAEIATWRGSQAGATIGGAKLWYERGKQRFYLLVSLTIQTPVEAPFGVA